MSITDRCEMWCDGANLVGPDGSPGTEEIKASCADCEKVTDWLCHDVLPSISHHGYYAPPSADPDTEFAAMRRQVHFRPQMRGLLADLLGEGMTKALMGEDGAPE